MAVATEGARLTGEVGRAGAVVLVGRAAAGGAVAALVAEAQVLLAALGHVDVVLGVRDQAQVGAVDLNLGTRAVRSGQTLQETARTRWSEPEFVPEPHTLANGISCTCTWSQFGP